MGVVQSSVYIQGNYLDKSRHCKLLELVKDKSKVLESGGRFGFETMPIQISFLRENKFEIDVISNSLDDDGFIRISGSNSFAQYKEYRKGGMVVVGYPVIRE